MKRDALNDDDLEIPEITDFSGGVVGKYYEASQQARNRVWIAGDLIEEFPDSASVNRALRKVLRERRQRARQTSRASGSNKT